MKLKRIFSKTVACIMLLLPAQVVAENSLFSNRVGSVGLFTNDAFGDTHDRWQTSSYQRSQIFEPAQERGFDAVGFRIRSQIVTPWEVNRAGGNRPFAAAHGFGLFGYANWAGFEARVGSELLMIGEQTGLGALQYRAHDFMGYDNGFDLRTSDTPRVGDVFDGRVEFELARTMFFGQTALLRPYFLADAGAETSVRVGTDFFWGISDNYKNAYWSRDVVTGQALPTALHRRGVSLVAGFDVGHAFNSYTIPDGSGTSLEKNRVRARVGLQSRIGFGSIFFGQAWISEEFSGQAEAQRLGMLTISFGAR